MTQEKPRAGVALGPLTFCLLALFIGRAGARAVLAVANGETP